ncbi:hypothetical protein Tco_0752590 [Tanacetum coccineum]|uniref:Uncharacterized protein n=1 Tax=Tanacetum coccineum TaxID=301880 RepID=A0ABQ4Z795_9ASTR
MVKVRDKRAAAYRTLNTKEGKEVVYKRDNVAEYKVLRSLEDVEKPKQNHVNNPQGAINKGGQRGERRKSGREIALKAKTKQSQQCLYCGENTNKHTKTTCPFNPKYVAKLARIVVAAEQGAITATATEQATRIVVVTEQATNAS